MMEEFTAKIPDSAFGGGASASARTRDVRGRVASYMRRRSQIFAYTGKHTRSDRGPAVSVGAPVAGLARVGRNDPCPCGSGKKFKKCCHDT